MKIYLDTADTRDWATQRHGIPLQGVTTNPTLVYQAGRAVTLPTYLDLVQAASAARLPELMLQLPEAGAHAVARWVTPLKEAASAAQVALTIKLPCHPDWALAATQVQALDLPVLLTGMSNAVQLLWAQARGARYVAPYIGRLQADGRDPWPLMQACVAGQAAGTHLLAASIKTPDVLSRLMAMGATAVTVRPDLLDTWVHDPLTQTAMAQFDADVATSQGC